MFEVTESAMNQLKDFFKEREATPIRVFLNSGGWGGPSLAMALDEQKNDDEVFEIDGIKYVIEKNFYNEIKPISIDFTGMGYNLTSNMKSSSECGSCGTTGSCCS